ncbi:MAG: hypothetical protein IKB10_01215 [Alphaproteobacteria bacterium]|nr:hypothetical protein [Alphaproteobacteria bacterium]
MTNQLKTAQIQEKVVIALTPQISKRVDKKIRMELIQQYRKLFAGFALAKWAKKYPWGRAWQNAISLNGAMIMIAKKKLTPNNMAVKYMENVHAAYKKYWSKTIMTHPERDTKTVESDTDLKKMRAHAMRMINDATNKIMEILRRYNERENEIIIEQVQSQEKAQTPKAPAPQQAAQTPATQMATPAPQQTATQMVAHPQPQKSVAPATAQPQQTAAQMAEPAQARPATPIAKPNIVATPVTEHVANAKPAVEKPVMAPATPAKQPQIAQPMVKQQPMVAKQVAPAQKKPYVAPNISVNDVKSHSRNMAPVASAQKPYVAPTITTRENAFACEKNRTAIHQAAAKMQIRRQVTIFTINQARQNVA